MPDPSVNDNAARQQRYEGTGGHFLASGQFQDWSNGFSKPALWLYGPVGCGKTVLCTIILEQLSRLAQSNSGAVAFFYFDFHDIEKTRVANLRKSIVFQLCRQSRALWDRLYKLYEEQGDCYKVIRQPLDWDGLFQECLDHFQTVWLVVDALDEADPRNEMLAWLRAVLSRPNAGLRILVTSRFEGDISATLQTNDSSHVASVPLDLSSDIEMYVHERLYGGPDFRSWRGCTALEAIERKIKAGADGM